MVMTQAQRNEKKLDLIFQMVEGQRLIIRYDKSWPGPNARHEIERLIAKIKVTILTK